MKRLTLIILIFNVVNFVSAQNTVHLCVGDSNHNFAVPYTLGSNYIWEVQENPLIATIISGNGTEHITLDLNNIGVFKLKVTETDSNNCMSSDSIMVRIHPLPSPNIFSLGSIAFCEGDSVRLEVDSAYAGILWNNGSTNIFTYADTTGDYLVTVVDTNGCANNSGSIFVDVNPNPNVDYNIDGFCLENPTVFTDISNISRGNIVSSIWYFGDGNFGDGNVVSNVYPDLDSYVSRLIVTSDYGCKDSLVKVITIFSNPEADFSFLPKRISNLDSIIYFNNMTQNVVTYHWNFSDSSSSNEENPTHIYSDPGHYEVVLTVSDSNQCIDSISHLVTMYYDFIIYLPNTFTPNRDGVNDYFGPKGMRMNKYKSYEFNIFNRWGELIFTTNKFSKRWDGFGVESGTYTWSFIITDELGAIRRNVGQVLLIK